MALSSWNNSRGKRTFDLVGATLLLLFTAPLFLLLAVLVKMSSPGPVFFRQDRVGKGGQDFMILKFRTMFVDAASRGPGLTANGDTRVTRVGAFLRKWKLDEVPQLTNVIRGDMSLVGPRPDLPDFIAALDADGRRILDLRPGITGAASLRFRHEEVLLATAPPGELKSFYVNEVLPQKVRLDLAYAERATFFSDLFLLVNSARAALFGSENNDSGEKQRRSIARI